MVFGNLFLSSSRRTRGSTPKTSEERFDVRPLDNYTQGAICILNPAGQFVMHLLCNDASSAGVVSLLSVWRDRGAGIFSSVA